MVCTRPDEGIGLEFFQIRHLCLIQSAAKHMVKKMAMHASCIATFKFDHINALIGKKEDFIKISAKNSKVNKTVIFMKENLRKGFPKAKIEALSLRCCLLFTIV